MTRVLIVGIARSGKTWTGRVLAQAKGAEYLDEPDNHFLVPYAFGVKRRARLRLYPALAPGEDSAEYEALWRHAFCTAGPDRHRAGRLRRPLSKFLLQGVRFSPFVRFNRSADRARLTLYERRAQPCRLALAERLAVPETPPDGADHVIALSAYAHLSAGWIADRLQTSVLIVRRDLRSVLGTWIAERWLDSSADFLDEVDPGVLSEFAEQQQIALPHETASPVARAAWWLGFLTRNLQCLARRHPEWPIVDYEELVTDPHTVFPRVAAQLGLEWTSDWTRSLESERRARSVASLRPRLSPADESEVVRTLQPFQLGEWAPWA